MGNSDTAKQLIFTDRHRQILTAFCQSKTILFSTPTLKHTQEEKYLKSVTPMKDIPNLG
jgi:5,10-methylene-tetrahydrofolate dehydrogenase/methenyl tetrahydrofolate cyclohydrolase